MRVSAIVSVLALVLGATACTPKPNPAQPIAQDFLDALQAFDYDTIASLVDAPDEASGSVSSTVSGLQAEGVTVTLNRVDQQENLATAHYTVEWQLPRDRHVTYDAAMTLT